MAVCTCANPETLRAEINRQGSANRSTWDSNTKTIDQTLYGETLRGESGGGAKGSHGAPAPVRFCRWAAPEITDKGNKWWANLFRGAAIAIALGNAAAQGTISDKKMDLAEGYYDMAKFKWDRFKKQYMPLEKKLLNEVSNVPIKEMDCAEAAGRAKLAVDTAYESINIYLKQKARSMRQCFDSTQFIVLNTRQGLLLADTENYNLLDEQWFTEFKNDQRWNRRSTVLNLGRNLSTEALRYGDVARTVFGAVGTQLNTAAAGVVQALGYYGARNDTFYPTTYLNQDTSQLVNTNTDMTNPNSLNPGS